MDANWRTCPACTGHPPFLRAPKSTIDLTMHGGGEDAAGDRTVLIGSADALQRPLTAKLLATSTAVHPREIVLAQGRTRIGKAPGESPGEHRVEVLGDDRISRNHAAIDWKGDSVTISDSGSMNGTFVNDRRVDTAPLTDGDVVRLGETEFQFTLHS